MIQILKLYTSLLLQAVYQQNGLPSLHIHKTIGKCLLLYVYGCLKDSGIPQCLYPGNAASHMTLTNTFQVWS